MKNNQQTTYSELLKDPRWQRKRLTIFNRDNWQCVRCGNDKLQLHVHHTYYANGKKPWEYPDEDLETLCCVCHASEHGRDIPDKSEHPTISDFISMDDALDKEFRYGMKSMALDEAKKVSDLNYKTLRDWEDVPWIDVPEPIQTFACEFLGAESGRSAEYEIAFTYDRSTGIFEDTFSLFGGEPIGIVSAARQLMKFSLY